MEVPRQPKVGDRSAGEFEQDKGRIGLVVAGVAPGRDVDP
jgi:hypothetical protein